MEDHCVSSLLDSLSKRFIATSDYRYIVPLDSFCSCNDEFLSEVYCAKIENVFWGNFKSYLDYLFLTRNRKCMEQALLEAFNGYETNYEMKVSLIKNLDKAITETKDTERKKYLNNLKAKFHITNYFYSILTDTALARLISARMSEMHGYLQMMILLKRKNF